MIQLNDILEDNLTLRPRYGEVDQMGYVYHANYVTYCHQARTELMRKIGVSDKVLEDTNVLLPVISFEIKHFTPAYYDQLISIRTKLKELTKTRLTFGFVIENDNKELVARASSTVVFVDAVSRKPVRMPGILEKALIIETQNRTI